MRWMLLSTLALLAPARAVAGDQIIRLLDNTTIVGTLLHYYDGLATIELPNQTRMRLPVAKVKAIEFKLPKPRAELSTPAKSFKRLREAALKGDLDTYVDTHSTYYQMILNHQIQMASTAKFVKQLKTEWGSVQLEVVDTKIEGGVAVMKVRRHKGGESQEGELRFVKENNEWKMILPL
jgi:C-terminal processing protease CtpA/Prc